MLDFFSYLFQSPLHIIEYMAAIIATFYFKEVKNTKLQFFVIFLWYICVTETLGRFFKYKQIKDVFFIYDVYTYIEQMYFFYIFYDYINNKKIKQLIIGFVVFLNISYFVSIFIQENKYPIYPSDAFLINQILLIITIFYFLIEFFLSDRGLKATNYLIFWISIAILFYYITFLPLDTVLRGFAEDSTKIIAKMRTIIIIILYSTYSFGFIWSKEKY